VLLGAAFGCSTSSSDESYEAPSRIERLEARVAVLERLAKSPPKFVLLDALSRCLADVYVLQREGAGVSVHTLAEANARLEEVLHALLEIPDEMAEQGQQDGAPGH
jgi:hypothetical protein